MNDTELEKPTGRATAPTRDSPPEDVTDGSRSSGDRLVGAAGAVAARWAEATEEPEIAAEIHRVCGWIRNAAEGNALELAGKATALRRHLLGRIRRELVRRWSTLDDDGSEARDPDRMRETLVAVEVVDEAFEEDWSRRFGVELSPATGMDVAAEIAHGLRSSCTSLLFAAEVLREGMYGELNEKQLQQIEVLYSGAMGLSTALSDLTELAWRSREEEGETTRDETPIHEPLAWARDLLTPVAAAKKTRLSFPEEPGGAVTRHPEALKRAIHHLVLHALFTAKGGDVVLEVDETDGGGAEIRITARNGSRDSEPESDPFRILVTGLEEGEYAFSSGRLRLHVARELVRSLGSDLDYRAHEDGSSMTFRLPDRGD